jgi:hypothetical protein
MKTSSRCVHCKRGDGTHPGWCPETDVDDALRAARPSLRGVDESFRAGYAIGLVHASLAPTPAFLERALAGMSAAEVAKLTGRIAVRQRLRRELEISAQPAGSL